MNHFERLLTAPADADLRLSVHLGHHIDEVADWPTRPERMIDGLLRSECDALVLERATALCACPEVAATVAETISTMIPLASSIAEVDGVLRTLDAWYAMLMEDGLFARIVEVKQFARDEDLMEQDPSMMDAGTRAAWHASIAILQHHVDAGEIVVILGGHEVIVTVETQGIDVYVQELPGSDDYLALYMLSYPGRDDRPRWDSGPHGDEPEPDGWGGPRSRMPIAA